MKALLSKNAGGPDTLVLEDVPEPRASRGQVVIGVRAAGVSFPDLLLIQDLYQVRPPRPFAPGGELAGLVRSVGPGVDGFAVGQRVLALCGVGAMAEKVAVDAHRCHPLPDAVPFADAAALPMNHGTAMFALRNRAALRPGETLLVLGAAGGLGTAAVETGKALGATVVAAVSSQEKLDFALASGADRGVVYPRGPLDPASQRALAASLKQACGAGADVVFDTTGGDYAEPALRALGWDGRYLVIGFPAGIPRMPLNLVLLRSARLIGVFWGECVERDPALFGATMDSLLDLYLAGRIRPRISGRFPLARGGEALAMLAGRAALGKLIIEP